MNLLRSSRVNPKLSAYAFLFGNFDYNKTPIVPPGTRVLAHTKVSVRKTWEENGEEGWYVGPSMEHYRCIKVFFPKSRAERNVDTVTFFPSKLSFPEIKTDDFLKQAAEDIIHILTNPTATTTPSLKAGNSTKNALLELATILKRVDNVPVQKERDESAIFPKTNLPIDRHLPAQLPRVAVVPARSPRVVQLETVTSPISNIEEKTNNVPTSPPIMEKVWKRVTAKK